MSESLPAGFITIETLEPTEEVEEPDDGSSYDSRDDRRQSEYEATDVPERCAAGAPQELIAKLYACSGLLDSTRYREASKFRDLPGMDWADARVALNRLIANIRPNYSYRRRGADARFCRPGGIRAYSVGVRLPGQEGRERAKVQEGIGGCVGAFAPADG